MGIYKKSISINGCYKELRIVAGSFVDNETGEIVNLAEEIESIYGGDVFKLTTSLKSECELDGDDVG